MKKITMNLLAVGVLATGLLASCSSETTTGVDAGNTNTEDTQTDMNGEMTDTTTIDTNPDTSYQNPPTDESAGNEDQ